MRSMGAAALIRDEAGALLIVKPTYREGWLLPGGMVEAGESPKQACRREIREEIGRELEVGRLLCVDYRSQSPGSVESLRFIFAGDSLDDDQKAGIVLQETELADHAFVAAEEALAKLNPVLSRLVRQALEAEQMGETFYLEDQERV